MSIEDNLPKSVSSQLQREIGSRLHDPTRTTQPQESDAEFQFQLRQSLPIWVLDGDQITKGRQASGNLARRTGSWHHQICDGDRVLGYATSKPHGPGPEDWEIQGLNPSSDDPHSPGDTLSEQVADALGWLAHKYPDASAVKLLSVPARQVDALWFEQGGRSLTLVAAKSARSSLRSLYFYSFDELLRRLADEPLVKGMPGPPPQASQSSSTVLGLKASRLQDLAWPGTITIFVAVTAAVIVSISYLANVPGPPVSTPEFDLRLRFGVIATSLVAFLCLTGLLSNRLVLGALIDERNRISLSRLQSLWWFVILVAGYLTEASWNIAAHTEVPDLPSEIVWLLAIVTGSTIGSRLILGTKMGGLPGSPSPPATPALPASSLPAPERPVPSFSLNEGAPAGLDQSSQIGTVDRNVSSAQASMADLFLGEEVANRDDIDVSRLQTTVLTLVLGMIYLALLLETLSRAGPKGFATLPSVSAGFVSMLAISHAAYLGYKATPKASQQN